MKNIALIPRGTGTGHSMRMYAIALAIKKKDATVNIYVYLESIKGIFEELFKNIGVTVINIHPKENLDYSKNSVMSETLTWESTIEKFLGKSFFNSDKVLELLRSFENQQINMIVSDLDASGIMAATMKKLPSVFVTERFNMPFGSMDEAMFKEAKLKVSNDELHDIKYINNFVYNWAVQNSTKVLTDCPYIENFDKAPVFKKLLDNKIAEFVGPMIRPVEEIADISEFLKRNGITDNDFVITASIGGTSMFIEDKLKMQNSYIDVFKKLKLENPNLKMVLLAREELEVPEGITCLSYLPDWYGLLKRSDLVLAHPGWITVTELCALNVPALFVLSDRKEYHEWEELLKLKKLEFKTNIGLNIDNLYEQIAPLLKNSSLKENFTKNYKTVAPWNNGAEKAAEHILEIINGGKNEI